jgi:hypothetical protein
VLDAADQCRFSSVNSGAALALDHLTLRHGSGSGGALHDGNFGDDDGVSATSSIVSRRYCGTKER